MKPEIRNLLLLTFLLYAFTVPVLAAEEAESGWGIWDSVGRFFNLFLLFGVIVYFVRKPLGAFFENRRREIARKLVEAQQSRTEAEARIREIEQRMTHIEQEISTIRQRAQQEMSEEDRRLEESSRQESEKIIAVARREIDALLRAAQKELRRYAGSLSVALAEETIRNKIEPSDQERIVDKFVSEMENMKR